MLISQPDYFDEAKQAAELAKNLPAIADVRRETLREGTSAQLLTWRVIRTKDPGSPSSVTNTSPRTTCECPGSTTRYPG